MKFKLISGQFTLGRSVDMVAVKNCLLVVLLV